LTPEGNSRTRPISALRGGLACIGCACAWALFSPADSHAGEASASYDTAPPEAPGASAEKDPQVALSEACGRPEAKLSRVAAALVARKVKGLPYLEGDGLTELLRRYGEPHVWPRAWIASGKDLDQAAAIKRLTPFGASVASEGEGRCGAVRFVGPDGVQIVAAIALDAVADLEAALPVRGRTGQWIELRAIVRVPATGARVVVTGPHGAPKPVLTSWDGKVARAKFVLAEPGAFVVQLVADTARGPRPVLEGRVFADVTPEYEVLSLPAPGEDAARNLAGKDALYAMVDALRASERLRPLKHEAQLEALADGHAARMESSRTLGHDVGDGDPFARAEEAGLSVDAVGENVANAESIVAAYRTLYRSPSHRANLVRAEYTHMGFAVRKTKTGYWVAQTFAKMR